MGRIKPAGLQLDPSSGIWRIDKRVRGHGRLRESTGSCDLEEAERYLYRRLEQLRQASVYGVRQKRKWREAATRYLMEEAINKDSGADDVYRLKLLDPFLGERDLHQVHDGTLASFVAWRRQPVKVKRKSGSITTHYSAAELRELLDAMEFIATDNLRESHALTLLKRKAG